MLAGNPRRHDNGQSAPNRQSGDTRRVFHKRVVGFLVSPVHRRFDWFYCRVPPGELELFQLSRTVGFVVAR